MVKKEKNHPYVFFFYTVREKKTIKRLNYYYAQLGNSGNNRCTIYVMTILLLLS